jgi:glycosyltransferase involved in cell wall biosynthesis
VNRPTTVTIHGLDWQRGKWGKFASWGLKRAEQASAIFPNTVIVVSRALLDHYITNYGATKVRYVPNGVRIPNLKQPRLLNGIGLEPDRYILFVGRLTPEKGCHHLLEAFEMIDTDMKLVIAGAPSYTDSYVDTLQRYSNDRVRFLGPVFGDLLAELYSNAYLFVLPSLLEGLSISLLEAMSYGCGVLASNIPANAEVVGECGFLFTVSDVSSLAGSLRCALSEPETVSHFGELARQHVADHYNWDSIATKTVEAYFLALGRPPFGRFDATSAD